MFCIKRKRMAACTWASHYNLWFKSPPSHSIPPNTYLLTPWNTALLEKQTGFQVVKKSPPPHFMKPESSLPHSQQPDTYPYTEPERSNPSPTSHFLKTHLNFLSSTSGSPKWFLPLRFLHQNPAYASPLPHMHYMLHPSNSSRFDQPNNIWPEVQIIKLLIT